MPKEYMGGLDRVTFENASVQSLAEAARGLGYDPAVDELDVGVAALYYSGVSPPESVVEGAHDGRVSDQEFLQGLIHKILENPVANEGFAVLFKEKIGVCLPFLLSDCDPTTQDDERARQDISKTLDEARSRLDPKISGYNHNLFTSVQQIFSNAPIALQPRDAIPQTKTALETLSGEPTACMGLQNVGAAVFSLASSDFDYRFYHLFRKLDGYWMEHIFGAVTVDGALYYLDPIQPNEADRVVPAVNFSKDYVAVPVEPAEFAALYLIYLIREDRKSGANLLDAKKRLSMVEKALLLAPQSLQVLLEAVSVFKENGEIQKSQDYLQKAKTYYPKYPG